MSDSHGEQLENPLEPDTPAVGVVYIIMILTILGLIVSFMGLKSFNDTMNEKARVKFEQENSAKATADKAKIAEGDKKLDAVNKIIETK